MATFFNKSFQNFHAAGRELLSAGSTQEERSSNNVARKVAAVFVFYKEFNSHLRNYARESG